MQLFLLLVIILPMTSLALVHLETLAAKYDVFLIDQWGVLHNGKEPYPHVRSALERLKKMNKTLILLSNSSKRKDSVEMGLKRVGIPLIFDEIITSGQVGFDLMSDKGKCATALNMDKSIINKRKLKAFIIGNHDDDIDYVNDAGMDVAPISSADFVLARGMFSLVSGTNDILKFSSADDLLKNIEDVLQTSMKRNLPMLVTNPDFARPDKDKSPMPGIIGKLYRNLNKDGTIVSIGKPYPEVYAKCSDFLELIKRKTTKDKICAIGDSLDHDVVGAINSGIDSIFICNGVHVSELRGTNGQALSEGSDVMPSDESLFRLYQKYNVVPTHAISCFKW
jgi:HAD superfamily hydrolase (TIGR01459 family)